MHRLIADPGPGRTPNSFMNGSPHGPCSRTSTREPGPAPGDRRNRRPPRETPRRSPRADDTGGPDARGHRGSGYRSRPEGTDRGRRESVKDDLRPSRIASSDARQRYRIVDIRTRSRRLARGHEGRSAARRTIGNYGPAHSGPPRARRSSLIKHVRSSQYSTSHQGMAVSRKKMRFRARNSLRDAGYTAWARWRKIGGAASARRFSSTRSNASAVWTGHPPAPRDTPECRQGLDADLATPPHRGRRSRGERSRSPAGPAKGCMAGRRRGWREGYPPGAKVRARRPVHPPVTPPGNEAGGQGFPNADHPPLQNEGRDRG